MRRRRETPYTLVLLDASMPELDGLTLAQTIRDRSALAATRIILLTSGDRPKFPERLQELRIEADLRKPVLQDELLDAIHALVQPSNGDAASLSSAEAAHDGRRILVAEDNEWNAALVQALLEKRGYAVTIAPDGREALARLKTETFALALVDLHMPELDGFGVVRELRQHERSTGLHLPVIALTARARPPGPRSLPRRRNGRLPREATCGSIALEPVLARWAGAEAAERKAARGTHQAPPRCRRAARIVR